MKNKNKFKIFMWMFFLPLGLFIFWLLIAFILDNVTPPEEKMMLFKLSILFGLILFIFWFIVCLITSIIINYLQTKFGKKILFIIISVMIPIFIIFYFWRTDCWNSMRINWEISMPYMSFYREIYHKDSGPSFLGDGTRYHVFSYKKEKYIEEAFDWEFKEKETKYNDSYSEFINEQLDDIGVLEKDRPEYSKCNYWYKNYSGNEIVICWNKDENKLYVIEYLM